MRHSSHPFLSPPPRPRATSRTIFFLPCVRLDVVHSLPVPKLPADVFIICHLPQVSPETVLLTSAGVAVLRSAASVVFCVCVCVQVALYAAEKLLELGAIPVTFSDSSGHIFEPEVRLCVRGRVRGCVGRVGVFACVCCAREWHASRSCWRRVGGCRSRRYTTNCGAALCDELLYARRSDASENARINNRFLWVSTITGDHSK